MNSQAVVGKKRIGVVDQDGCTSSMACAHQEIPAPCSVRALSYSRLSPRRLSSRFPISRGITPLAEIHLTPSGLAPCPGTSRTRGGGDGAWTRGMLRVRTGKRSLP